MSANTGSECLFPTVELPKVYAEHMIGLCGGWATTDILLQYIDRFCDRCVLHDLKPSLR